MAQAPTFEELIKKIKSLETENKRLQGVSVNAEENRKKIEEQLLQSQKMEAIGNLASGVAHDLNNILSGIISYPELILMELPEGSPLTPKRRTSKKQNITQPIGIYSDFLHIVKILRLLISHLCGYTGKPLC